MKKMKYKVCANCNHRARCGYCPLDSSIRHECPEVMAEITSNALADVEVIPKISVDLLAEALRFHGYTGQLTHTYVKTI